MITSAIELTATEFDIAWHELGLGRLPYPLAVPSAGATMRQRRERAERVRQELGERGLRYDTPDSELARYLGVLAGAETSVDAVGRLGGALRALAARDSETGVTAVLSQDTVWLMEIWPEMLVESIVDLLAPEWPGPGSALSVPVAALADATPGLGPWRPDEAELAALLSERVAGGQFGVNVAGGNGTRRRADTLVSWFDTRGGRYLVVRQGGWLSLAPADNQRIAYRIREVIAAASADENVLPFRA